MIQMIMYVPFVDLKPNKSLRRKLDAAHDRVMASGIYIGGIEVERFENAWMEYVGTQFCVGTRSGTEALRILVGDETPWIPRNSLPTMEAIHKKLIAPQLETHNIAPVRGRCAVPVHLYGQPADIDSISAPLIYEDACQAHGAKYKGRKCGALGNAAAWSFYPTKNLGCYGNAGAITTNEPYLASRARRQGRMSSLQAAYLHVKLPYLDRWNARRKDIANQYLDRLEIEGLPIVPEWAEPCWHLFVITHPARDALKRKLKDVGVETMIHYTGTPKVLSLPCHHNMTLRQVEYVIGQVNKCA